MKKGKSKLDVLVNEALALILAEQKLMLASIKERLEFELQHQPQFLFNETPASLAAHELKAEIVKSVARLALM